MLQRVGVQHAELREELQNARDILVENVAPPAATVGGGGSGRRVVSRSELTGGFNTREIVVGVFGGHFGLV